MRLSEARTAPPDGRGAVAEVGERRQIDVEIARLDAGVVDAQEALGQRRHQLLHHPGVAIGEREVDQRVPADDLGRRAPEQRPQARLGGGAFGELVAEEDALAAVVPAALEHQRAAVRAHPRGQLVDRLAARPGGRAVLQQARPRHRLRHRLALVVAEADARGARRRRRPRPRAAPASP